MERLAPPFPLSPEPFRYEFKNENADMRVVYWVASGLDSAGAAAGTSVSFDSAAAGGLLSVGGADSASEEVQRVCGD
jgi:hypothetical protein